MRLPILDELPTTREMIDVFGGYNHNLRIGEGEFYDMKNLTSSDYPVLSPRPQRGVYSKPYTFNAVSGGWQWVDNRLDRSVGPDKADEIRDQIDENPEDVWCCVSHIDKEGNVRHDRLDEKGNVVEKDVEP